MTTHLNIKSLLVAHNSYMVVLYGLLLSIRINIEDYPSILESGELWRIIFPTLAMAGGAYSCLVICNNYLKSIDKSTPKSSHIITCRRLLYNDILILLAMALTIGKSQKYFFILTVVFICSLYLFAFVLRKIEDML
ncbi:MAG: hypothetical protein ACRDD8_11325 [Bacteroidales bacterium]